MARKPSFRIHPDHLGMADAIITIQSTGVLERYADVIRAIAREHNIPLADIHKEWARLAASGLDTDVWLINGLNHPDHRGHRLAAHLVFHHLLACRP
jgi:lysophospholipase L1-like esterase